MRRLGEVLPISTDGAFFPDGRHFVLRDYGRAAVYSYPDLEQVGELDLPEQEQGEGIAVDEDGEVYVSSEGVGSEVLRIELPDRLRAVVDGTAPERGDPRAPSAGPMTDRESDEVGTDQWPGILLSPWVVGGVVLVLVLVVLLLSLRPRPRRR
jgi:hypothetical protein